MDGRVVVVDVHTKTDGDANTLSGAASMGGDGLIDGTTAMGILVAGIDMCAGIAAVDGIDIADGAGTVCGTGSMNGTDS